MSPRGHIVGLLWDCLPMMPQHLHSSFLCLCGPGEFSKVQSYIYPLFKDIGPHIQGWGWGRGGGALMECLCLLMAFQINTTQLCSPAWETRSAMVALMGWSPLMKSLLDSIDRFILALSPMSVHFFSDPLSHCKVIDTKPTLKSSWLLWYDLAQ